MGAFASYIAQSALVMTMLYLAYKWLMAYTTFHSLNRAALLCVYAAAWTLPFFMPLLAGPASDSAPSFTISLESVPLGAGEVPANPSTDWWRVAVCVWLAGACAAACFSLVGMARMWRIIRSGERTRRGGYVLVVTPSAPGPFSWGRYMVLRPEDCDADMRMVTAHEEAHLRRLHWLDLIPAQLTVILQWFSPAAWLMMRELKTVHEFQADCEVAGDDPAAYQMMLLKKTVGSSFPTFADSLNHSQIKLRITMMMTKRTRPSRMVTALALPAMAALAAMTLSQPAVADVILRIGSVTVTDGGDSRLKVTKSSPSAQIPGASIPEDVVIEEAAPNDSPASAQAETANETVVEETSATTPQTPAIFLDGKEFRGELSAVNPKDIVAMDIVKNDPQYPQGKIMITTVNAADGTSRPALTAEKTAEFKGGTKDLMQFIAENIKYPAEAKAAGISGRVIVSFTIGTDGSVTDAEVVRGIDPALDREALRVVSLTSGRWLPGIKDGTPVASRFAIPISFKSSGK